MVRVTDRDGITIVEVFGDIDIFNAEDIFASIYAEVAGVDRFILSLENCRYCDSTAASSVIKLSKFEKLFVVVARANVKRVLELLRLDLVVPLASTVEEAIELLDNDRRFVTLRMRPL